MILARHNLKLGFVFDFFAQDVHDRRVIDRILAFRPAGHLVIDRPSLAGFARPQADRRLTRA